MQSSVRYFFYNYAKKKPNSPGYMDLGRIEGILSGMKVELAIFCELLYKEGKVMEAKGIYDRN